MHKRFKLLLLLALLPFFTGCVLTKVLTVPMRVGAAAISIIPVAGNTVHEAIDEAAEIVDDVPI